MGYRVRIGGGTLGVIEPPFVDIGVELVSDLRVDHITQAAPAYLRVAIDGVVPAPRQIFVVEALVALQHEQELGEFLDRPEVGGVDVGVGRGVGVVVGLAVDDGDGARLQRRVQPLADVVGAQRRLQHENELVIATEHLVALGFIAARLALAFVVHVHADVFTKFADDVAAFVWPLLARRCFDKGNQPLLPVELGVDPHRFRRQVAVTGRQAALGHNAAERVAVDDVRIAPVRHRPVEFVLITAAVPK